MKKSFGYNRLKGKASNTAHKRTSGTISPINKLAAQSPVAPATPPVDKCSDNGEKS